MTIELEKRADELHNLPKKGIPYFGICNNTPIMNYLGEQGLVSPVQGVNAEYFCFTPDKKSTATAEDIQQLETLNQRLANFVFNEEKASTSFSLIPINNAAKTQEGEIHGETRGGVELLVQSNAFTKYHITPDHQTNGILMIEGMALDAMRATLQTLKDNGQLEKYEAVVLGRYYSNLAYDGDIRNCETSRIEEVIQRIDVPIPVYFGAPWGHPHYERIASDLYPQAMYADAVISKVGDLPQMTVAHHRSKESCEYYFSRGMQGPVTVQIATDQNPAQFHLPTIKPLEEADAQQTLGLLTDKSSFDVTGITIRSVVKDRSEFPPTPEIIGQLPIASLDAKTKNIVLLLNDPSLPYQTVFHLHESMMALLGLDKLATAQSLTVVMPPLDEDSVRNRLKVYRENHPNLKDLIILTSPGETSSHDLPDKFSVTIRQPSIATSERKSWTREIINTLGSGIAGSYNR